MNGRHTFFGAVPAIWIAATTSTTATLPTGPLFVVTQFLEDYIFAPRFVGDTVGLNRSIVIIALVAGAALHGVIAALLAVPIVGVLQVLAKNLEHTPWKEEAQETHLDHGISVFDLPEMRVTERDAVINS